MRYEDFTIQIGPDRGNGHSIQVLKSPAGEGSGFLSPISGLDSFRLLDSLARTGGTARSAGTARAERDLRIHSQEALSCDVEAIGDQLFRALFPGPIRTLWDQSLGIVRSRPGWGLRIKLKLDMAGPDLANVAGLPWELLWQRETEDFLSLSRHSPFLRYLDVPRQAAPIRVGSKLRILVVTSNPPELPALDLRQERHNLEAACRHWKGTSVTFLDEAEPGALRQALLADTFHVLHFMGHGGFDEATGEGVLYFERPGGHAEAFSGRALATFLKDFKSLGLVVLNACDTARVSTKGQRPFSGVASALVLGGIPAVIAMQFPISDQAAIAFSTSLYQRLAMGDPLDTAVVEGRQAVLSATNRGPEWATPVLFSRVPDADIFQVSNRRKAPGPGGEPDDRRSRVLRLATACLIAALLGFATLPAIERWRTPAQQQGAESYSLNIGRGFESSLQGLSGTLTRIELTRSGRMRLYFRFRNASSGSVGLGFDYGKTYLADKAGNRYGVAAADGGGTAGETGIDQVNRGGEIERWIEFPAPRDGARRFHVGLTSYEGGPSFPLFEIELPEYPKELSTTTPPHRPAAGSTLLPMEQAFSTALPGLKGSIRTVELLAGGRMRWSFAFLNGTDRDLPLSFDYSKIRLRDELGNEYPLLGSNTGGNAGQYYREILQRAVRADHWFEFGAPINGARQFTVILASHDRGALQFLPFKTRVPFYPARYSRSAVPVRKEPEPAHTPPVQETPETEPQPVEVVSVPPTPEPQPESVHPEPVSSPVRYTVSGEWKTSIPGLTGGIESIAALQDGRLRLTFQFRNNTGTPQEVGFALKESYLADNLGRRYSVVGSDVAGGDISFKLLADGQSVRRWVDFPAPAAGAFRFTAVFASHSRTSLRFLPFLFELPVNKR